MHACLKSGGFVGAANFKRMVSIQAYDNKEGGIWKLSEKSKSFPTLVLKYNKSDVEKHSRSGMLRKSGAFKVFFAEFCFVSPNSSCLRASLSGNVTL